MIMVAPEAYETYVRVVRSVANELASCATEDELAAAYGNRSQMLDRSLARVGVSGSGLELELVLDAAFQLRQRELEGELRRADVARRIAAMQGQAGWVVLTESGLVGGQPFPPYERVEMHLPDGTGLLATVELDDTSGRPVYAVETVQLDPATGGQLPASADPGKQSFPDSTAWEQAVAARRGGSEPAVPRP
jgi:hypothetical protein